MPNNQRDIAVRITGKDLTEGMYSSALGRMTTFERETKAIAGRIKQSLGFVGLGMNALNQAGIGGNVGQAISGITNIGNMATMGGLALGPIGAAFGGAIGAIQEIKAYFNRVAEESKQMADKAKAAAQAMMESRKLRMDAVTGSRAGLVRVSTEQHLSLASRFGLSRAKMEQDRDALKQRMRDAVLGQNGVRMTQNQREETFQELEHIQLELSRLEYGQALSGLMGMGGRGIRNAVGGMQGGSAGITGSLRPLFSRIAQAGETLDARVAMIRQLESPAQAAQRELNELEGKREILGPDLFNRGRGAILDRLRGMLPEQSFHSLTATESRFLTRGNDVPQRSPQLNAIDRTLKEIKTLLDKESGKARTKIEIGHAH